MEKKQLEKELVLKPLNELTNSEILIIFRKSGIFRFTDFLDKYDEMWYNQVNNIPKKEGEITVCVS